MKFKILTVLVLFGLTIVTASAQYKRTDLMSNQSGVAPATDSHLVNGWGLVALPTSPYWVSDNGTGFCTLYTANGKVIEVDNIWALQFGQNAAANGAHNQLFFTAGANRYANGLFGVITVGP